MEEPGSANYQLLIFWEIRAAVLLSFTAHLFIMLLASIRRRKASVVRMLILWVAYQVANWVAPFALNMSSCGETTSQRRQLVAFWATFLLHNLGGPDNMSDFSLEDNALYRREALLVLSRVLGPSYFLYKHLHPASGAGALIPASIIVLAVGAAKYAERVWALWQGDLGNIRGSSNKKEPSRSFTACASAGLGSGSLIKTGRDRDLDDEEALMVAHDKLRFCRRAMADSSVVEAKDYHDLRESREIFTLKVENMYKVVEMELSLTYDILYTKAAVIHTRLGYGIRVASPLAIAAASVLHHAVLCTGRWRRLRSVVVSLDLGRLRLAALPVSPSSYRRWSGTVGQYSLLRECTRKISAVGRAVKAIGLEDIWNEYQHSEGHKLSQDVKDLVFERVKKILRSTYEGHKDGLSSIRKIMTSWGHEATKSRPNKLKAIYLAFGGEFQEDILVWHIATQVFLVIGGTERSLVHGGIAVTHAKAIKALSEYLMFLGTVRQHMLPGLVLRGLYEATKESIKEVWRQEADIISGSITAEEKLAMMLLLPKKKKKYRWGSEHMETLLLKDAITLAKELLSAIGDGILPELLEMVFNVWVEKLLHAATRCRPESHANQLSCGGDLTTIVMIMAQHAGSFKMSELGPDNSMEDDY